MRPVRSGDATDLFVLVDQPVGKGADGIVILPDVVSIGAALEEEEGEEQEFFDGLEF